VIVDDSGTPDAPSVTNVNASAADGGASIEMTRCDVSHVSHTSLRSQQPRAAAAAVRE
jgi:hypothetical protein